MDTYLYEKVQELGIEVSQCHGRKVICHDTVKDTEAAIKNARLDCMAAHYLHAPYVVFHGVTKYFNGSEPTPEVIHELNETLFGQNLESAREFNVKVATETFGDDDKGTFAVKMMRFMLRQRYGDDCCCFKETDNSWLSYTKICDTIS